MTSPAEILAMFHTKRRNKYNAKPCEVDGIKFASKKEAARYQQLVIWQKARQIYELVPHPSWDLVVRGVKIGRYTADASYRDIARGDLHVVDFKSPATARTEAFRLRKKLMWAIHGIEVEIVQ